jgi:hypothetical protein
MCAVVPFVLLNKACKVERGFRMEILLINSKKYFISGKQMFLATIHGGLICG